MVGFSVVYARYVAFKISQGHRAKAYYHLSSTWLPHLGQNTLDSISPQEITQLADRLSKERNWSDTTRTCAINVLSGLFTWAEKMAMVDRNPCRLVPRKTGRKLHNEGRFVLSKQQLQKLLHVLTLDPCLHDLVLFAVKTGMRFTAITSLTRDDIHKDEAGTAFVEIVNKNDDLHRVYLVGQTLELAKRNAKRSKDLDSPWLFSGPNGGRMWAKYIQNHFPPACRMAGIPYGRGRHTFTFHGLRRAFASHLLNNGASIDDVMEAGGWRSHSVVKRYAYLSDQRKKDSFRKMDKIL